MMIMSIRKKIPALIWMPLFFSSLMLFSLATFSACSAPQDGNFPGYCRLSCSKTSLAASNFTIDSILFPTGIACASDEGSSNRRNLKWVIRSPITRVDGSEVVMERPAIEFNLRFGGNGPSEIITPESEWCSDSCGVASVEVEDACPPAGSLTYEYSALILSGAIGSSEVSWANAPPPE
jgi:hypothetical protein